MTELSLSDWKDLATIVGTGLALLALIKGVLEYAAQGAQKRAEQFFAMRKKLKEDPRFREMFALMEDDDPKLAQIPFQDKRDLLGLFEELAILLNSGLIRESVAHYMFGYYAIRCWESSNFWYDVNRDSDYWALFRDFVLRMKAQESRFAFNRDRFRF